MGFPTTELEFIVEAYLGADPTADPETWPTPQDFTSRLLRVPIPITRGRRSGQKTLSAGSCVIWLDNTDAALTPLMATSTFYPEWDLGVPVRVSLDNVGLNPPYVRFAGFVADMSMVMVPGAAGVNISAVRVTLGGVWRRISQGTVVKSPLLRTVMSRSGIQPIAYWPMEDGEDSIQFANALAGGTPMTNGAINVIGGVPVSATNAITFATNDLLAGSRALPSFGGTTYLGAQVPDYADTGKWVSLMMFYLPRDDSQTSGGLAEYWTGNATYPIVYVDVGLNSTPRYIRASVYLANLTTVFTSFQCNFPVRDDVLGQWMALAVSSTADASGANDSLALTVMDTDGNTVTSGSTNVAADFHAVLRRIFQRNPDIAVPGTCWGHSAVYADASWALSVDGVGYARAAGAYLGEQVHERIGRICGEEGIPYSSTATQSNEAGPQPIADAVEVLAGAEAVDHGILLEDQMFGLGYRASSQRENLSPALTIDLATYRTTKGTQADVLTPVRNDARIRNEWTISRPDGSNNVTVIDEAHQAKKGRYNDAATVNVEDDTRLVDEAQWRVHEGTFDGLRYQTVPLDIAANQD